MKTPYKFSVSSSEELHKEIGEGIPLICVWFFQTHALPVELFKERIEAMNNIEKITFYAQFRTDHPEIFENASPR